MGGPPLRVLHVVPSYWPAAAYGGPIESVHALCRAEAEAGARVGVLTTDANGESRLTLSGGRTAQPVQGLHVRYCRRWAGDSVAPGLLARLPREVVPCDVVHLTAVYSYPTIPTLLVARIFGKPVVWSPRGSLQTWAGTSRRRLKASWRRACEIAMPRSTVLHVTSEGEDEASRAVFPGVQTVVIPNGVDVPRDLERSARGETLRLLFLGRLHPIKAIENLIAACSRCHARGFDSWRLRIAGAGEPGYQASLRDLVVRSGLSEQVAFVGPVDGRRKTELLLDSDLVVVPSHTENFGMVVVEALAHGVPVVASEGTPWRAIIERGCGFWVGNDPDSLADALLAARSADLAAMGKKGRLWMRNEYRWESVAARMIALYRRVARLPEG